MNRKIRLAGLSVFVVSCLISMTGCSLAGYGLGILVNPDKSTPILFPEGMRSLEGGVQIIVLKKNGDVEEGTFVGFHEFSDTIPAENYKQEFEDWRLQIAREPDRIPRLGTNVRVRVAKREDPFVGNFAGFDPGKLRILTLPGEEVVGIKLDYVQGIDDSLGNLLASRGAIVQAIDDGVPLFNRVLPTRGIMLKGKPGIKFDDVASVTRVKTSTGKWIGLGIGAALDVLYIIALSQM